MSFNPTEHSSDNLIDEPPLELETNDFSDPYIVTAIVENQDHGTFEDIGFQDYFDLEPKPHHD